MVGVGVVLPPLLIEYPPTTWIDAAFTFAPPVTYSAVALFEFTDSPQLFRLTVAPLPALNAWLTDGSKTAM